MFAALALPSLLWAAPPASTPPTRPAPRTMQASAIRQVNAIKSVKAAKSKTQSKIDSRLYLAMLHKRGDARLSVLTTFRFVKTEADGRVPVDIILASPAGVKQAVTKVQALGGVVRAASVAYRRVTARVHLDDLEALAALPDVRKVRQSIPAKHQAVNVSEGDKTHGADEARGFFGTNGTGVKVCVLSDGVDSLTALEASGDLPPGVQVLPGQAGAGDEGSAMLEIVHDLAPGATLEFATADTDEATFAQNILDLATAGCNVIADDVIYLDESPFEDGPVAQAVNTVTAAGVLYFSSAGNYGNVANNSSGTWEGDFKASTAADPAPLAGANLHDFGDGGQSISVTNANDDAAILIWAEHYDINNGFASTDYDLYDMDDGLTTIFDASTETQDGTGGDDFPIEFLADVFGGDRLLIDKFASGTTSSSPMFNLIVFDGTLDAALATNGATRGHSSAAAAFSVAATPAAASFDGSTPDGPYPGLFTTANAVEFFTSDGPRRIILDTTGAELTPGNRTSTGGVVRQKPDITAADGVSCAAPGFDPFYGTSAAAPHAAAIAALLKSAKPGITPAQVRTALIASTLDIETAGVDIDSGAGIVMAHAALTAAGATPMAFLAAGTAVKTQVVGDGDAFVENNEIWSLEVPLTNNGGAAATGISAVLATSTPGVTITSGSSNYSDLAIGATGNNTTPFAFLVTSAATCGASIQFTLTVSFTGGISPQVFTFSIKTGSPGTPQTFSFTGPPVAIPDGLDDSGIAPGAAVTANLPVSGITGNIYDVNFRIDGTACSTTAGSTTVGIDHSFVSDLVLKLIAPDSTTITMVQNVGGGGNNFCQTLLDDEDGGPSIQSVSSTSAPFTGSYTPDLPLAGFSGKTPNGTWQLQAQDFFSEDTGNIRAFSLVVTPAVCDAPAIGANVSGTETVTGSFSPGGAITYTVVLTNNGAGTQQDNPGHEFTDVLPSTLTLVSASATSGAAVANVVTNTVTWDGSLAGTGGGAGGPGGGSVTISINATVKAGASGTVSNQGTISYDADGDGTNESTAVTDDPSTPAANDPTTFAVGAAIATVPTLSDFGLAALGLALMGAALVLLRRRREQPTI